MTRSLCACGFFSIRVARCVVIGFPIGTSGARRWWDPRWLCLARCRESLERCRRDDALDLACEVRIKGDEDIRLQLGHSDVFGVGCVIPVELLCYPPGEGSRDAVAEEADAHRGDAVQQRARLTLAQHPSADILVKR